MAYSYEPYGDAQTTTKNVQAAPSNPMRFAGEFLDSTVGLYNLRARQYDPTASRFLSRDALQPPLNHPHASAYLYADAKPTTLIDPAGLSPCSGLLGNVKCIGTWAYERQGGSEIMCRR